MLKAYIEFILNNLCTCTETKIYSQFSLNKWRASLCYLTLKKWIKLWKMTVQTNDKMQSTGGGVAENEIKMMKNVFFP